MENANSELGDAGVIQDTVQRLLDEVTWRHYKPSQYSPLIGRAHDALRILSLDSFRPRAVDIGPVHHGDFDFEEQKSWYLIHLMDRISSTREEIMESCVQKVYASLEQIKSCYDREIIEKYDNASIVQMIVKDACFILEFIYKISRYDKSCRGNMLGEQIVIYDLVLLENQIPFYILNQIFQCTVLKFKPNISLIEFIRPLLNLLNIFKVDIKTNNLSISTTRHILSLLHQCYKPHYYYYPSNSVTSTIHSVVDLDSAGVNFKPDRNPKCLTGMDVKLNRFPCFSWCWGNPTLRMPVLYVHDFTELVLRNLIAYEHQTTETPHYITSYASAMDMLVKTPEDVAKLSHSSVLVNIMGSNEKAANMINSICKQVEVDYFFYTEEWKFLSEYWESNIAWLRRTYFRSPWNSISLLAGIILFFLSVIQTIFTIKPAVSKN